jgi:hypothetical protein
VPGMVSKPASRSADKSIANALTAFGRAADDLRRRGRTHAHRRHPGIVADGFAPLVGLTPPELQGVWNDSQATVVQCGRIV